MHIKAGIAVPIFLLFILCADGQTKRAKGTAIKDDSVTTISPDGRYLVRFSAARSEAGTPGRLWGAISIRNRRSGRERTVRVAAGQRGNDIFQAFCRYEDSSAWSPDGLYLAYWDDSCIDEPAVTGGVVCQAHEIRFLSLREEPRCREELVLGRYNFGGWVRGRPHTVLEILEEGKKARREPCVKQR